MSAAKSERVLNLLIALLTTKRFLTKQELREMVEGYRDAKSFDRTFERDKAELRDLGIIIETGSNDADSDDEDGYRINRSEFELPEVQFTGEELVAIGLAAHTWQASVGAEATSTALLRLRAAGAAPDLDLLPPIRAHIPVVEPTFDVVYRALLDRQALRFDYAGTTRGLQPWKLSQRRGLWLVVGYDTDRGAPRRFKLSRMGDAQAVGPKDAYEVPDDIDALLEPATSKARAVVAIRDIPELIVGAQPVAWEGELPEGFTVYEVERFSEHMIADEICAAGPDAIALEPESLREMVVARLRRAQGVPA